MYVCSHLRRQVKHPAGWKMQRMSARVKYVFILALLGLLIGTKYANICDIKRGNESVFTWEIVLMLNTLSLPRLTSQTLAYIAYCSLLSEFFES